MSEPLMRAAVLHKLNDFPEIIRVAKPVPAEDQALIRVEASALNRRDDWIRIGMYPHIQLPSILASDVCGVVEQCDAAPELIGRRVVLCPSLNWGSDENHQSHSYHILGMPSAGGLADYICHPVELLVEVPEHLDAGEAAAFSLAGLTAWRALMTQGGLKPNHRVLITGAGGGVGSLAALFAQAFGAKVWISSGKQAVIEDALTSGLQGGVSYREDAWWKSLPRGMDVIIDGAGGEDFGRLISLLGMGGRLVFYGGTNGKWPAISPQHLFFKQAAIVGSTMGSPTEFQRMWHFIAEKKLKPTLDSRWPLEDTKGAFKRLLSKARRGKVVIEVQTV